MDLFCNSQLFHFFYIFLYIHMLQRGKADQCLHKYIVVYGFRTASSKLL